MNNGFIKLMRSEQAEELLMNHPREFALLTVIAYRARRTNIFDNYDLKAGEALIGDYENYGMTEQKYRTTKDKLQTWGLITCRATSKGTIAKLVNSSVYDINLNGEQRANQRDSNGQATGKQRLTRSKERKNERNTLSEQKNRPSLADVKRHITNKKITNVNSKEFYRWYKHNDWKDRDGNPLTKKNYKAKINTWSAKANKIKARRRYSQETESKYGQTIETM